MGPLLKKLRSPSVGCFLSLKPTADSCIDFAVPRCTFDWSIFAGLQSGSLWCFLEDPKSWMCRSSSSWKSLHNFQAWCQRIYQALTDGWLHCWHYLTPVIWSSLCSSIPVLHWGYLLFWLYSCLELEVSLDPSPFELSLAKLDWPLPNPKHSRLVHPGWWTWTCHKRGNPVLQCSCQVCSGCRHRHKKEQEHLGLVQCTNSTLLFNV